MTKRFNSTLEQHTPLKAKKRLERRTSLKAHKGLNKVSDKQRAKNELWNETTEERCRELGYICQWCHRPGQRNDPTRFDYLTGHHTIKRRYNIHTKEVCYIAHLAPCHGEIEDNNIDVLETPDRESWLRSKEKCQN